MKIRQKAPVSKRHTKSIKHVSSFCTTSINIISFLAAITIVAVANLFLHQSSQVLGASTSVYTQNCSTWNIFCKMSSFFHVTTISTVTPSTTIATTTGNSATALPLGDGKVSTSAQQGYVYSCITSFSGGGAETTGSWITGSTWDPTKKTMVKGSVAWPNATFTVRTQGNQRIIIGNGLPLNHTTGTFPISTTDPAYLIDKNPNSIKEQTISLFLPLVPTMSATPTCVGMGMVGIATDGVPIFNALDEEGRDAVAHEVQDTCDGHPQQNGMYHYHGPSACIKEIAQKNTLVGYALDGYGIYSRYDAMGKELTNADLDACHGITSKITWNGQSVTMYHYVMTREYPYTIGCYRGSVIATTSYATQSTGNSSMPHQQAGNTTTISPTDSQTTPSMSPMPSPFAGHGFHNPPPPHTQGAMHPF